ncbi:MotE family protein [Metabacillus niabensis]|uniref:MotE family protein n=1 Tax=Metabacillus niabensis TaxID=324854 RepID=UPI0039A0A9BA
MENEKHEYGKFQWFIFVILIPVLFTITLVVVILSVAGVDILGKTKAVLAEVPIVEKLFDDEKEKQDKGETVQSDKVSVANEENKKLENTIEEQTSMISALEQDVTNKETEIQKLQQEIKSLEEQLETINQSDSQDKAKDISKLYDNMSSKKAAEIIPKLNQDDALTILTSLDDKQVADILAKMTVDDAVKFTSLLASPSE